MRLSPAPAAPTSRQTMGTRFRPADPVAVHQRFAAIRARAVERVAEEQRSILARLARERVAEKELWADDHRRDGALRDRPHAVDAGAD